MSSQSDGSGRPDDIVVIKQLLQKLEEAANRGAEARRDADQSSAAEPDYGIELAPESKLSLAGHADASAIAQIGTPANDEPLLALSTLKTGAPATVTPATLSPDPQARALSIGVRTSESTALVTTEAPQPTGRGRRIAIALASFVLGIAAAGGMIIAFDPLKQLVNRIDIARTPGSATELSRRADGQAKDAATVPAAAATTTVEARTEAAPPSAQADAGSGTTEIAPTAVAKSEPKDAQTPSRSEPESARTDAGRQAAATTGSSTAAPAETAPTPNPPAQSERPALRAPSRIEVKVGAPTPFDLRVTASADDLPKLLLILRQMPPWLSLSKGGSIGNSIWLIPAQQVRDVELTAADGSDGQAELKVQLANLDGTIVSETTISVHAVAAAVPLSAPADPGSPAGNEALMLRLQAQGQLLLDTGEIEAARTLLRTAAEAGSVMAALRLAETYDPSEMRRLGMAERIADVGQAVRWYEHAQALGSPVATARLIALGRQ